MTVHECGPAVRSPERDRRARRPLGLRSKPGGLALALSRLPLPLYRRGRGWLPVDAFLLFVHEGRKTGEPHATVAMALRHDPQTHEAVICSVWGENTDWIRNIRPGMALRLVGVVTPDGVGRGVVALFGPNARVGQRSRDVTRRERVERP